MEIYAENIGSTWIGLAFFKVLFLAFHVVRVAFLGSSVFF